MKHQNKEEITKMRLDKWLFAARFFKTRGLAHKALEQGKVLYEGQKANASREIKIGAKITLRFDEVEKAVIVQKLSEQRLSAPLAQELYTETEESLQKKAEQEVVRQEKKLLRQSAPKPPKRPEKGARRLMREMRRKMD
jgi:ribosome-associated heat shock protein Hsp15